MSGKTPGPFNPEGSDEDVESSSRKTRRKTTGAIQTVVGPSIIAANSAAAAAAAAASPAAAAAASPAAAAAYDEGEWMSSSMAANMSGVKRRIQEIDVNKLADFGNELNQLQLSAPDVSDIKERMGQLQVVVTQIMTGTRQKLKDAEEEEKAIEIRNQTEQRIMNNARNNLDTALTDLISDRFSTSQQLVLLQHATEVIRQLNLDAEIQLQLRQEISHISRMLEELPRIMYNVALARLSGILVSIKNISPTVATHIVSFLAGIGLTFQYLPQEVQSILTRIPYLGRFFNILQSHPTAYNTIVTNVIPSISTMYYYLRNSGLDINSVRNMLHNIAVEAKPLLSSGAGMVSVSVTKLRDAANGVASNMIERLSDYLTSDYFNAPTLMASDNYSVHSQSTDSTLSSNSSNATQASMTTQASMNLISSEPDNEEESQAIVEELASESSSVPVQSSQEEDFESVYSPVYSPLTDIDGGRKRTSYLKYNKSKKGHKSNKSKKMGRIIRKGRITRKSRKQRKTAKRHRIYRK